MGIEEDSGCRQRLLPEPVSGCGRINLEPRRREVLACLKTRCPQRANALVAVAASRNGRVVTSRWYSDMYGAQPWRARVLAAGRGEGAAAHA